MTYSFSKQQADQWDCQPMLYSCHQPIALLQNSLSLSKACAMKSSIMDKLIPRSLRDGYIFNQSGVYLYHCLKALWNSIDASSISLARISSSEGSASISSSSFMRSSSLSDKTSFNNTEPPVSGALLSCVIVVLTTAGVTCCCRRCCGCSLCPTNSKGYQPTECCSPNGYSKMRNSPKKS